MLSEAKILETFIKSIAKTTGVITVLSVIGGILYITTDVFKQKEKSYCTKLSEHITNNNNTINNEKFDKNKNIEQENDDISMTFIEDTNEENTNQENTNEKETAKYKKVLDKIFYK